MCDYATRYPEVITLKKFTAPAVAEELIELFSRHGVPREILTDQGTNFTSQLLQELYKMIGVTPIKTTPYHCQTDRLVEHFNQTLKQMLRRLIEGEGREWNKLLPYVLFAYREVPQFSTGFSPFELLYGRDVRGPLDVLKEGWTRTTPEGDDIVSYVDRVHERLEAAKDLVQENMRKAQAKQKAWYDQRARELQLQEGEQVLVMLPTRTEKLLAKWKGPFKVLKKVGKVNYEVEMPNTRKKRKLFHVNMLKRWQEPEELYLNILHDELEEIPCLEEGQQLTEDVEYDEQLSEGQCTQVHTLLTSFPNLIGRRHGTTPNIKHHINTSDEQPVRQRLYRVPPALKEYVVRKIQEMIDMGVVEESTSAWSSPMVIVKKKDGTNRICVDYRKLNSWTKFDAYPMPRIDDLLDAIGQSPYLTTIDLMKGYWQVPMNEDDKEKTAFTSQLGLLQFKVMPFGLSGAPATFERLMDHVLRGTEKYASVYLDDIIMYGATWEEHLMNLRQVLQRLDDAGLTIRLKKCQFGTNECTYLGYRIGLGGVRPEALKVKAVQEMSRPQTKKQVRRDDRILSQIHPTFRD